MQRPCYQHAVMKNKGKGLLMLQNTEEQENLSSYNAASVTVLKMRAS